jgi:inhibitor of KinA sporulation pathway (predicted exonuclease)
MPDTLLEYYGQGFVGLEQAASLDDQMNSMRLFRRVKATEVIYTEGGLLCYKY